MSALEAGADADLMRRWGVVIPRLVVVILSFDAHSACACSRSCNQSTKRNIIVAFLQLLLEVESRQATAGLFGGHGLGNLHPHLAVPAPAVEAIGRSLDLRRAYEHFAEA